MTTRRRFLRDAALVGGAGLAACASEDDPGPTDPAEFLLPESARPDGLFELYLYGGVAHWDTFYTVPEFGDPAAGGPWAGGGWWAFQQGKDAVGDMFEWCGAGDRPLLEQTPWATDAAGKQAFLGPWLYPLRERPDIVRRMRVVCMRHTLSPHQTANALAQTGLSLGDPRAAGTAAHLRRALGGEAFAILPRYSQLFGDNADALLATGLYPASARPISLWLGTPDDISHKLPRDWWGGRRDAADALGDHYAEAYARRLVTRSGGSLRAPVMDDLRGARAGLLRAPELGGIIRPGDLDLYPAEACDDATDQDVTTAGLALGRRLLSDPRAGARYVALVDSGFEQATNFGGYDSHLFHVREGCRNILHASRRLAESINEPGEGDPTKLDLDRHTIAITTEFGRSIFSEGELGTNHHPWGYVHVLIGGAVDEDRAGIVGSIGEDGYADTAFSPGDFRAALLLMMGVWPFDRDGFAVGDVSQGRTRAEAAAFLREELLGYRLS